MNYNIDLIRPKKFGPIKMWIEIKKENRRIIIIKAACVFQNRRVLLIRMTIGFSKHGICHALPKIIYQSTQTAKSAELAVCICHKWSPCCLVKSKLIVDYFKSTKKAEYQQKCIFRL